MGVPILVYANKQDLIGSATSAQIAEGLNLHTIKVRIVNIQATSLTMIILARDICKIVKSNNVINLYLKLLCIIFKY